MIFPVFVLQERATKKLLCKFGSPLFGKKEEGEEEGEEKTKCVCVSFSNWQATKFVAHLQFKKMTLTLSSHRGIVRLRSDHNNMRYVSYIPTCPPDDRPPGG